MLPEWNATYIQKGHAGFSFAMRTNVTHTLRFFPSMFEDYYFRQAMMKRHLRTLQSPHVTYYVKGVPRAETIIGTRIVNINVCTSCGRPVQHDLSYEYQLARVLSANSEHDYEYYRRLLLRQLCQPRYSRVPPPSPPGRVPPPSPPGHVPPPSHPQQISKTNASQHGSKRADHNIPKPPKPLSLVGQDCILPETFQPLR